MGKTRISHDTLLSLIELAYAASEPHGRFEPFLHAFADTLGGNVAALVRHDMGAAGGLVLDVRSDPEAAALYNQHWHRHDPWALNPKGKELGTPGRVLIDQMLMPYDQTRRTAFCQEYGMRFGLTRLLSANVGLDHRVYQGLSLLRGDNDEPFGAEEMAFLQALVPHVQRAIRLRETFDRAAARAGSALEGLEFLPVGVLFVDALARLVHANRAGLELLASRDGLTAEPALTAASPAWTAQLHQVVAECQRAHHMGAGRPLAVPRPSGRSPLQVLACPVPRHDANDVPRGEAVAVLFVDDPHVSRPPARALLQAYFGLTAAEASIAERLALGVSTDEVAGALGYTVETCRWYVKQLMSKTGCRSRYALVRQLSGLVMALERPGVE